MDRRENSGGGTSVKFQRDRCWKASVKFQRDQYKTVGGVALTRSPLQTQNHAKKSKLKMWKK